jgi:MFS family permease
LLANRRWVFFLAMVFMIGISAASVSTYLFLYMKSLGADEREIGLALSISTISEIIMYLFSERILRRFKWRGMMLISLPIYIVRLLLYSVTGSPTVILVIQLLHGFTVPAIWAAGISFVAEAAPPGLGTTAQGIFAGCSHWGVFGWRDFSKLWPGGDVSHFCGHFVCFFSTLMAA